MRRRTYLTSATVTALGLSVAGCVGSDGDDDPDTADNDSSDDDPETDGHDDDSGDESEADDEPEDEEETPEELPDLVGTFDDFEELDAWEAVVGTLEADGERAFEGSQSARLTASEAQEQIRISRELSDPIDVTDVVPGLAFATSSAANVVIQLHDEDGDYLQYQQLIHADHPFLRQNFGHTAVSGEPDATEITEIQIVHWTGDGEGEVWVDDLHFVPRVETGRVMFQFQGGFETDYTHAFPILEAYDLTGSTFVATDRIRPSGEADGSRLTLDQLDELVDAGWSLGTVGARHQQLHRIEPDENESHILEPIEWFDEHGYDDARYFAFPGGRYDQAQYDLVAEHYDLGYAGRFRSQGWASNPYTITRISGDVGQRNLSAEELIDALDWTAARGGITTIVFYEMDGDDAEALEAAAAHLADLVAAGELELITPGEFAEEYVP